MAAGAPVSAGINARIVHASLVTGVVLFWLVAWYIGRSQTQPIYSLPDRRVLYISLFLVSAVLFGAAMFTAGRLTPPVAGQSQDDWWARNLGKAIVIWALVEAPSLLGLVAYVITDDFRTLLATLTGLLLFGNYRPGRLLER
jgi:heme A synthase